MSTQFQKGQSGNPYGISSEARTAIQRGRTECARQIPSLIKELGEMNMMYLCSQDLNAVKVRVTIIKELLDRGMGKALQMFTPDDTADGMDPRHMTKVQIDKMIEGNFFGAVADMIETKNERFMELVNKANAEKKSEQENTQKNPEQIGTNDKEHDNRDNNKANKTEDVIDASNQQCDVDKKSGNKQTKKKGSQTHPATP